MKTKDYKTSLKDEPKKERKHEKSDKKWIFKITALAFFISLIMSLISELIIPNTFIVIAIFLVLIFIFIGVLFDIIGLSVQVADSKIFHSMATKKVKGAKKTISLIKSKDKVSSILNDVVGDICGVVSGSCGLAISISLSNMFGFNKLVTTIIVTSIISALTIGGKAFGKTIAINNSNEIIFDFAKILNMFSKEK